MSLLRGLAEEYGIILDGIMLEQFDIYRRILLEWNENMNLTAITGPLEITVKHFLDSLTLLKAYDIPPSAALIDIGTGAGFPGIPLKIARPDIKLTLLDSREKRLVFLRELSGALGQDDNSFYHARAEDAAHLPELRERFDVAAARAVAALPVLCEYCLPFVGVGGVFIAMKGPDCAGEIKAAQSTMALLGGALETVREETLTDAGERVIILLRKTSQTPTKYPRISAKISKTPL